MTGFVHHMHSAGQAALTWGAVDSEAFAVHHLHMAKTKAAKPLSPPRNFIKEWRKRKDLTLEQLADAVGMSHASIQRVENGRQNYSIATLQRIANVLGTNAVTLLLHGPIDDEADLGATWAKASTNERKQIAAHAVSVLKWREAS